MSKPIKTTEKELEILQIVWERKTASVKDIHADMGGDVQNGYTTILKLMQIMHDKGLLSRQKSGKLHIYRAVPSRETTREQLLDKMIHTVFQGSASKLVLSALGNQKSTKEELREIREYLEKLEGGDV
jgi:predicted transcriptional regulator